MFINNIAADPTDRYFPVNAHKERKVRAEYAEQCLRESVFEFDEPGATYMSVVVRGIG